MRLRTSATSQIIGDEWFSVEKALRGGLSLALIGNASGQIFGAEGISIRGVFDKETRRKPLAFAADAVRYGISTAAWI